MLIVTYSLKIVAHNQAEYDSVLELISSDQNVETFTEDGNFTISATLKPTEGELYGVGQQH